MSSAREVLALRREVLLARASLQRLQVSYELATIREAMRWPRAAAAVAASSGGRSVLFGLLLLVAGRGRVARFLRVAAGALALAKLAVALAATRASRTDSGEAASPAQAPASDPGTR